MQKDLISNQLSDVEKTKTLLKSSIKKYAPYDSEHIYTPDELEYYDSLAFRFEKCVEITINFFRSLELFIFAKQSETLRDRLLEMQKINIIEDIDFWVEARLLRNKIAHTYLSEDLEDIYQEIHDSSQELFNTIARIKDYLAKQFQKEEHAPK